VVDSKSGSDHTDSKPFSIVGLICLAEALSMTGFAAYPAFLALLRDTWSISNSEAGFIGGAFFAGYMGAVPFLASLTDRFDARRIHAGCCLLAGFSNLGFALFAEGVVSAALFQALAGAGLGGTYMPGLKALTDRVTGPRQSRFIAFYTSTFGVGTSTSFLLAGWLGRITPWDWAFGLLAAGPFLAALIAFFGLKPLQRQPSLHRPPGLLSGFRVLADRAVLSYVLRYGVHCWELFGLRSWLVAFVIFGYGLSRTVDPIGATEAAALINLLGIPASVLGNEAAGRFGRTRYISLAMAASGCLAWLAGLAASWPWWAMLLVLTLYYIAIMSDSAALTAGLVATTPQHQRGAAMAVYSFAGFGAGFIAPLVFGVILDIVGGKENAWAWTLAFGSLGMGCLFASVAARARHPSSRARRPSDDPLR
jgi:MFS family permease